MTFFIIAKIIKRITWTYLWFCSNRKFYR